LNHPPGVWKGLQIVLPGFMSRTRVLNASDNTFCVGSDGCLPVSGIAYIFSRTTAIHLHKIRLLMRATSQGFSRKGQFYWSPVEPNRPQMAGQTCVPYTACIFGFWAGVVIFSFAWRINRSMYAFGSNENPDFNFVVTFIISPPFLPLISLSFWCVNLFFIFFQSISFSSEICNVKNSNRKLLTYWMKMTCAAEHGAGILSELYDDCHFFCVLVRLSYPPHYRVFSVLLCTSLPLPKS